VKFWHIHKKSKWKFLFFLKTLLHLVKHVRYKGSLFVQGLARGTEFDVAEAPGSHLVRESLFVCESYMQFLTCGVQTLTSGRRDIVLVHVRPSKLWSLLCVYLKIFKLL
jgi:hypothetical protein